MSIITERATHSRFNTTGVNGAGRRMVSDQCLAKVLASIGAQRCLTHHLVFGPDGIWYKIFQKVEQMKKSNITRHTKGDARVMPKMQAPHERN